MKKSKKFLKVCKSLGLDPNTIPEIMSFESACKRRKMKPVLPIVNHLPERHRARVIADYKLAIITEAFNLQPDGTVWEPNYNDTNEAKYEPRFWIDANAKNPSGFGFRNANYDDWHAFSSAGSCLAFKEYSHLKFAQAVHEKLYLDKYLIFKKKKR